MKAIKISVNHDHFHTFTKEIMYKIPKNYNKSRKNLEIKHKISK